MSSKEEGMKNAGEMFRAFMEQQGMNSEIKKAAKLSHELYTELVNAGFNESQAMYILVHSISGG